MGGLRDTLYVSRQKLVFPDGIVFDKQMSTFRTGGVNYVFAAIANAARVLAPKEKGRPALLAGRPFM